MATVNKVTGGDKMLAQLRSIVDRASSAKKVEVGFFADKKYPDGTSVAYVAALNEFGTDKAPPRPFFRGMISEKSGEWPRAVSALLKANRFDAKKTLGQTGEAIAGQLRTTIANFDGAPLAPSTVARKGSAKQLVDTGVMLDSIGSKVE